MVCEKCNKEVRKDIRSTDGLCGKCRSRNKYLANVDTYRKTKNCPDCGKSILKTSSYCNKCSQIATRNHQWKEEKQSRKIYNVLEWRLWRNAVLKRDNRTCQECGNTKGRIHAHHILPKRFFPYLMFNVDNGITLCQKCHSDIHFKEDEYANKLVIKRIRPK
jgi:5-methylcytosine-specific restriction endonuclease McrA